MNEVKTVAILGAGPVGLAAAAHLLERGLEPVVLEAGPLGAAMPCASGAMCACSRPGNTTSIAASAPAARRRRLECAARCGLSDRRRACRRSISSRWPRVRRCETASARGAVVTSVGRMGFDKAKSDGRDAAPFEIRYENGSGPEELARRCGDRRHGHLVRAQSRRRRRPCRRAASARCRIASPTACPTCWAASARAMPASGSPCWAPAIPPSAR